ncbi:intracellular protein transport protein USO1 [Senna tora]|uniref:Intracellular protein transport protein USO1 n=1 Tax=Senna tora TaxID=362788 RepID=A0A834XJP3_9FABA|nr:intracellular protein transport protein USO1 [Senna tora]
MNVNPKTEPSSAPASDSSDVDTTSMTLRIPDLIFQLRFAIRTKQFDNVERVLVAREAQLKREVEKLREISDFERLERMQMEDDLKNIKEEYEKSKRAEELYEKLMGAMKKNGLRDEEEDATINKLIISTQLFERRGWGATRRVLSESQVYYSEQYLLNGDSTMASK